MADPADAVFGASRPSSPRTPATEAIRFGDGERANLLGAFPLATAAAVSSWLGTAYQLVILSHGRRRSG